MSRYLDRHDWRHYARRVVEVVMAPVVPVQIARHVARPDQQDVAAAHLPLLGRGGRVEVDRRDRVSGLERAHASPARDVEEDAAAGDSALGLVDAVLRGATAGDERGI